MFKDSSYRPLVVISTVVLSVAALSWAQKVLIPVAMAFLLTFVLGPLVNLLQRARLRRVPAVILSVLLAIALIGGGAAAVTIQLNHLVAELPEHQENIARKIAGLRDAGAGAVWENVQTSIQNIMEEVAQGARPTTAGKSPSGSEEGPITVRVESSGFSQFQAAIGPAAEILANIALVTVLVSFMLIQREDLRNRIVRLIGHNGLVPATRAIDEATHRISRFLVSQVLINTSFGLVLSFGLFLIGVPYAFLWGALAGMLRFIPYLGTWAAAVLLIGFTVVIFKTWTPTIYVFVLFAILEICTGNVAEPLVFGHSTGISTVALVVAAAFWTWLWGPIGLILSTPLTACVVVLGRYVSNLAFFDVLLSDEPALDGEIRYYQRLLAHDHDEASELVEEFTAEKPLETLYDKVLLPALSLAKRDRERGDLQPDDEKFIIDSTREILDELAPAQLTPTTDGSPAEAETDETTAQRISILACPARDEEDYLSLRMFQLLMEAAGIAVEVLPSSMLTAEVIDRVGQEHSALVCIGALPPSGLAKTRYLCKRLRAEYPRLPILVGRWGAQEDFAALAERIQAAGATHMASSVLEMRDYTIPLVQALSHTTESLPQSQSA